MRNATTSQHWAKSASFLFTLYALITLVALWSLMTQINSAVPGAPDTDFYQFHWNYWWMRFALLQGQSPLWTDYVLYPHVSNLSYHTLAPIWLPVYWLAEPLMGRVAAGNLLVMLGFPLTGLSMSAWLWRMIKPSSSSKTMIVWLGGLLYAFSPFMLDHAANMHLNLTTLWWFPLTLLLWDEIVSPRRFSRWLSSFLLGLALWGTWLTDLQYPLWLPFTLGCYGLWTLWAARKDRRWVTLVGWGMVAVAIMAVLLLIWPLPALLQLERSPDEFPPAGLYTARTYSLPPEALIGLATPVADRTLGRVLVWLAWGAVFLGLWRWWRTRRSKGVLPYTPTDRPSSWFWLLIALPPLILSLGPDVTLGETVIDLPYLPLHNLMGGQYRQPVRFVVPALASLITFLALAWTPWLDRLLSRTEGSMKRVPVMITLFISGVLLVDAGVFAPFPTRVMPDYDIYHQIGEEDGDFVILDVPLGTHSGWTGMGNGQYAMFYGPDHQHRMVNGTFSRVKYSDLAFYFDSPLFSWLAGDRDLADGEQEIVNAEFAGYLDNWPVGYVIAHRDWMPLERQTEWIGWLNTQPGLCPAEITADGTLLWWRSEALGCEPVITAQIDMGTTADWIHVGAGWHGPESIGGPDGRWANQVAILRVTLDADTTYTLTFSALAFGEDQTVTFGDFVDSISLSPAGWSDYTVTIPADALADALLVLRHNNAESPAELGLSEDSRLLSAAYGQFTFHAITSP